jgi:ABC-2 type transport system permease protein
VFTLPKRQEIKRIALTDPANLDQPFATWSLSKLADYLVAEGVVTDISIATIAAGVALTSSGTPSAWSDIAPMIGQAAVYLTTGMIGGVAFGAILRESAPAIVVLFTLPIAWAAAGSLSFLSNASNWLDTLRAVGPMHQEVLTSAQWARAATAIALWNLLPLVIGAWRITRREAAA